MSARRLGIYAPRPAAKCHKSLSRRIGSKKMLQKNARLSGKQIADTRKGFPRLCSPSYLSREHHINTEAAV